MAKKQRKVPPAKVRIKRRIRRLFQPSKKRELFCVRYRRALELMSVDVNSSVDEFESENPKIAAILQKYNQEFLDASGIRASRFDVLDEPSENAATCWDASFSSGGHNYLRHDSDEFFANAQKVIEDSACYPFP